MKSLAVIVFLYLVVPGSGQLAWDGLPFSTRLEFASLVVVVLAVFNRGVRAAARGWLDQQVWRSALKPVILLLCVVKLITFAWYPFSDGFDACYRSLYSPLENPGACEKSYEGPFLRRSDLGLSNTSRIDRTVDFGTHTHDWSLPFMNEYPRLGALWLNRFPFTATYGAIVDNTSRNPRYLPIYSNGEMEANLGDSRASNIDVPIVDQYMFTRLNFLAVPPGRSELLLRYKYTDDDVAVIPDVAVAPAPRGPYAILKVGEPLSRAELLKVTNVHVRGWTVDTLRNRTPDEVVAINKNGVEVARSDPQPRPDVAMYVKRPSLTMSGFSLLVPATRLVDSDIQLFARYGTRDMLIATLSVGDNLIPTLPNLSIESQSGVTSSLDSWFDTNRDSFTAFAPEGRYSGSSSNGLLFMLLSLLCDLVSGLFVFLLSVLLLRQLRWWLVIALMSGGATLAILLLGKAISPKIFGSNLSLSILLIIAVVVGAQSKLRNAPLLVYLPAAVALAYVKVFDHLERFHDSEGARWWGRLLYYWRDSDWYTTQGYARTIFIEGSLRGGEGTFWFQSGPRYLAFVTRSLLGENDVLVGLLMTTLGFFAVFFAVVQVQRRFSRLAGNLVGGATLFVAIFFMADDLMAGFGFVGSSEYPTWIVLFALTGYFVTTTSESRAWVLVMLSIALGYSIQLRPNQIGGVVAIFLALVLLVDRRNWQRALGNYALMTAVFGAVVSLSLLHNLYYGESFVPFTANGLINVAFNWSDVLSSGDFSLVWAQLRTMMYWNTIGNWSWALAFWGSQLLWLLTLAVRLRAGQVLRARTLLLLIPFGYALPMLKYQMGSYYPRHLVAINLAFGCAALMAWPHSQQTQSDEASDVVATPSIDPEPAVAQLTTAGLV